MELSDIKQDQEMQKMEKLKTKRFYMNVFPATLTWIVFHGVALSLATSLTIFLLYLIHNLKINFNIRFRSRDALTVIAPVVLVIVVLGVFGFRIATDEKVDLIGGTGIMEYFNIVFDYPYRTTTRIMSLYFLIAVVPLVGIVMVNIAIGICLNSGEEMARDNFVRYNQIKDSLNIFALFSGLLVAAAIIGTRLQRDMLAEQIINLDKIYPDQFIYSYGISHSLILGLIFLPSLAYLKYLKRSKKIDIDSNVQNVSWWKIGKESIDDMKLILSLVLPFISSIVQSFIS